MRSLLSAILVLLLYPAANAQSTPPAATPSADELADVMRSLLKAALPTPLYQDEFNWGETRQVANGITWKKKGILRKPVVQEKLKNDGMWRRIKVEAIDPDKTLTLRVHNVQKPEKGKLTFMVVVTAQTRITLEQQLWLRGKRLYSGETRARCKPVLVLACESTTRTVKTDSVLPDVVFRMRVTNAKLSYEDLKVEHTAGLGGDAAKVVGEAGIEFIKTIAPRVEKKMLDKANQAIVKAADTKEIKLGLGHLFEGK